MVDVKFDSYQIGFYQVNQNFVEDAEDSEAEMFLNYAEMPIQSD